MWSFSDKNLATILVAMPVFFFTVFARALALQDFFLSGSGRLEGLGEDSGVVGAIQQRMDDTL